MIRRPPRSTLFPTRRSSDLTPVVGTEAEPERLPRQRVVENRVAHVRDHVGDDRAPEPDHRDRKSTRLNSSHLVISYAVFCLKKKKHRTMPEQAQPAAH